jgi:hypothetical protein
MLGTVGWKNARCCKRESMVHGKGEFQPLDTFTKGPCKRPKESLGPKLKIPCRE